MVFKLISVFNNWRDNNWFIDNRPIPIDFKTIKKIWKYRNDSRYNFVLSNAIEV